MSKLSQISIKLEPELHQQFMKAAKAMHRPAAQMIRELMRTYLAQKETPNTETRAAIEAVERGEMTTYKNVHDFYTQFNLE